MKQTNKEKKLKDEDDEAYTATHLSTKIRKGHQLGWGNRRAVQSPGVRQTRLHCPLRGWRACCACCSGLYRKKNNVPIVTIETDGAQSFYKAHKAQKLVTLDGITSVAKSLGALTVSEQCLKWSKKLEIHPMVIGDAQCVKAMNSLPMTIGC